MKGAAFRRHQADLDSAGGQADVMPTEGELLKATGKRDVEEMRRLIEAGAKIDERDEVSDGEGSVSVGRGGWLWQVVLGGRDVLCPGGNEGSADRRKKEWGWWVYAVGGRECSDLEDWDDWWVRRGGGRPALPFNSSWLFAQPYPAGDWRRYGWGVQCSFVESFHARGHLASRRKLNLRIDKNLVNPQIEDEHIKAVQTCNLNWPSPSFGEARARQQRDFL